MLHKTPGIVFRFTRFGDTSIIVNVFTELHGLQSYIVNGVRSSSAKGKIALYQPLTLLDMVVYYKENQQIKRIKEVKCLHQYHSIHKDVKKSAIAMFLNEVLNKTVKEESHSHGLYEFISSSLITLDNLDTGSENFHLIFLIRLSRLLGFGAHTAEDVLTVRNAPEDIVAKLSALMPADYSDGLGISIVQRRALLDLLLKFYSDHLDTIGEFKSASVLKEVLG
jgi:DNA repair protein RecO (recombination protein O)